MICPLCGRKVPKNVIHYHLEACQKHPGDPELVAWWEEGLSAQAIADRLGVDRRTAKRWLEAAGVTVVHRITGKTARPAEPLALELAPYRGRWGNCNKACPGWARCRILQLVGGWALCSAPPVSEVEWFISRRGYHEQTLLQYVSV